MSAGGVDAPRSVAKRTAETQSQIDAAKAMPGNGDPDQASDPAETPAADEADAPVKGRGNMPGVLPGTTFGRGKAK